MALSTSIALTVSDYDIKMSRSLKFYKNDSLKLIFTINYWGIDNAHGIPQKVLMPLEALSAVLFMETPDGTDSVEAGAVEGNVVTFYLNSEYTQNVGVSRMQIRLFDDDGCAITLPEFPFEIKENIGTLSESAKGWTKELNLVSWNGAAPKYDLRDWAPEHEKMGKGITLNDDEVQELYKLLSKIVED